MADGQNTMTKVETRTRITQVLGAIRVASPDTVVDGKPAGNSTRWLFDIESSTKDLGVDPLLGEVALEIQLLDPRSHKTPVVPDILSCSFTAKNAAFYSACPHYEVKDGYLFVRFTPVHFVSFRVAVDAMHSATR